MGNPRAITFGGPTEICLVGSPGTRSLEFQDKLIYSTDRGVVKQNWYAGNRDLSVLGQKDDSVAQLWRTLWPRKGKG